MSNVTTKIDMSILDYVFFTVKCKECGTNHVLDVDDLNKRQVACSQCNSLIQLGVDPGLLQFLSTHIDSYCKQLQNAGIDLYFVHKPESKIEIPHSKPLTDT